VSPEALRPTRARSARPSWRAAGRRSAVAEDLAAGDGRDGAIEPPSRTLTSVHAVMRASSSAVSATPRRWSGGRADLSSGFRSFCGVDLNSRGLNRLGEPPPPAPPPRVGAGSEDPLQHRRYRNCRRMQRMIPRLPERQQHLSKVDPHSLPPPTCGGGAGGGGSRGRCKESAVTVFEPIHGTLLMRPTPPRQKLSRHRASL
jgi:hypothetical protein